MLVVELAVELVRDQKRRVEKYLPKICSHRPGEIHFSCDHLVLDVGLYLQRRGAFVKRLLRVEAQKPIDAVSEQRTAKIFAQGRRQSLHHKIAWAKTCLEQK